MRIKKGSLPAQMLHSELESLSSDGETFDFTPVVLRNLERLGISCLIVIGGDDTLGFATMLHSGISVDCYSQDDGQRRARDGVPCWIFDSDYPSKGTGDPERMISVWAGA
jgi:hypothetical protein